MGSARAMVSSRGDSWWVQRPESPGSPPCIQWRTSPRNPRCTQWRGSL